MTLMIATDNLIKSRSKEEMLVYVEAIRKIREWWHEGEDNSNDVCDFLVAIQHDIQAILYPHLIADLAEMAEIARDLGFGDEEEKVEVS